MDMVHRMFGDVRPIDWIIAGIDFLVLLAILWFEIPEWMEKRRAKKFAKAIHPFVIRGQEISSSVQNHFSPEAEQQWMQEASVWTAETKYFLSNKSLSALVSFNFVTLFGTDRRLHGHAGDAYQTFHSRLRNLHRISEHPELFV